MQTDEIARTCDDDENSGEGWEGTWLDLLVLGAVGLHGVAFVPGLSFSSWTPHMALLLVTAPVGLLAWLRLIRRQDTQALLLGVFVAAGFLGALLSGAGWAALLGSTGRSLSVLTVACLGALWAAARGLSAPARRILPVVIVTGLGLSALIGVVQVSFRPTGGALGADAFGFNAYGLGGNPVHFGSLMAGAAVALASLRTAQASVAWLGASVAFTMAAYLSGSRIALLSGLACTIGLIVRSSDHRFRFLGAWAWLSGVALGWIVVKVSASTNGTASKFAEKGLGSGGRVDAWEYGVLGAFERPMLGWGFGEYRTAAQAHFDVSVAQSIGIDSPLLGWSDPHNVVISVFVAAGLVGLALMGWFSVSASRSCRGPLAVFAVGVAIPWLLQPATLVTLPLVAAALGASHVGWLADSERKAVTVVARAVAVAGFLAGLSLVAADVQLAEADGAQSRARAATWYKWDAQVASSVARAYLTELGEPDAAEEMIRWARRAVELEPHRPLYRIELAAALLFINRRVEAQEVAERALDLNAWDPIALTLLDVIAEMNDDVELRARLAERICAIGLDRCDAA